MSAILIATSSGYFLLKLYYAIHLWRHIFRERELRKLITAQEMISLRTVISFTTLVH